MDTPNDRLRQLRIDRGFQTAADAANYYGWPVSTYRAHENGGREVSRKAATKYAAAFKTTLDYLLTGKNNNRKKAEGAAQPDLASQPIQIISWASISSVNTQEAMLKIKTTEETFVPRRSGITGIARCVIVGDDSSTDITRSHKHSFLPGDEIIFDPSQSPKPGDLVIARHPLILDASPRIYALRQDAATGKIVRELVPINPSYPSVRMVDGDNSYICGVVVKFMRAI
jgi:SOS-response transcriptional repressor LexA